MANSAVPSMSITAAVGSADVLPSAALDLPTGPVIACALLGVFVAMVAVWKPLRAEPGLK
jgi:hypothetical protein